MTHDTDPPSAPVSADAAPPPPRIRARGRSFLALVLSPEAPLDAWLRGLDVQISHSVNFFNSRPVILDLGLLEPETGGLSGLLSALKERHIHIIGIEGADPSWPALAHWDWPAILQGGRPSGTVALPEAPEEVTQGDTAELPAPASETLFINRPVRSGQTIENLEGDVVIVGGVSSGAEIIAGGSIHVYGPLRGRAIAGINRHPEAQIFTLRLEAELLAIDGFYLVAEEIDPARIGHSAQIFLEEGLIKIQPLPERRVQENGSPVETTK
ncbi:septum site-determining protein MinC [Acetobacteraceae bacterium ESL0709]|nr:septum site-determining protein MinC [Acetobacteraceae bacterium ESL0697]MDF7678705.1 septum site-determining protein MinC [Acetobacteraceae bacterium ESL0709]